MTLCHRHAWYGEKPCPACTQPQQACRTSGCKNIAPGDAIYDGMCPGCYTTSKNRSTSDMTRDTFKATELKTFTVFCQQENGEGTIWIEAVQAKDSGDAERIGWSRCAEDWGMDVEDVRVLGVAEGDVNITAWYDR